MTDTVLSAEQIESFVEHGYVRIPKCFTREDAQPWLDEAWVRLGYDRDNPATWVEQRVHMPSLRHVEVEHSPVERAVLRGLEVERLDHRAAAPREDVVPERVRHQERMGEQEEARLAEASS